MLVGDTLNSQIDTLTLTLTLYSVTKTLTASARYIVQIVQLGLLRHHVTAFKKGK